MSASIYDKCSCCGAGRWAANLPPEARGIILNALQTHAGAMELREGGELAADLANRVRRGINTNERFSLAVADGLGEDVFKQNPARGRAGNRAARRRKR